MSAPYDGASTVDLSKDVLWVSVGQRVAKLQPVKVGGLKKYSAIQPELNQNLGGQGSRPG